MLKMMELDMIMVVGDCNDTEDENIEAKDRDWQTTQLKMLPVRISKF